MWLRNVSLGLFSGILLLYPPFIAGAQSSDARASSTQTVPDFWEETPGSYLNRDSKQFLFESSTAPFEQADSISGSRHEAMEQGDAGGSNFSATGAQIDLLPLLARWREHAAESGGGLQADVQGSPAVEKYHWKGLLWQSLGFIGVEDGYRLSTDFYMRHLIAVGPYWSNYITAMQHWDMDRWSDGDDFVVDDIGHPMQGAVSSFIEIQNSPSARSLRIGTSSAYWKSRLISVLWSTAFSTQQKIGPLGEAALGNAGGYTYALHCPFRCTKPGAEYTNNTGWTDFIMTPAGGTVWMIGEDFIDRFISDRIQGDGDGLFPKIVRGTLNPTRTMANAMRGRSPWYRDWQHPEEEHGGVHFERSDDQPILPRYEVFPHFNALSLPVNTSTCTQCRSWTNGAGVGFSARLSRWVDFDSDVDYQPGASPLPSYKAGGDALIATFGFRTGFETPRYALKAAVRPGFVSYNDSYLAIPSKTNPVPATGRLTHFAAAVAIDGDYGITSHLAIRGLFGNTPVRYLDSYSPSVGNGHAPYFNWLSKENIETNENWTFQMGPVLKF